VRFSTAVGERVLAARAASGLTARQLQALRLTPHGMRMNALALALKTPKSTMTSVIDQLESMGLAIRGSDDGDGRGQIVHSTPAGQRRLHEFDLALANRIDELVAYLSTDQALRLRELMRRLPSGMLPVPLAGPR
jgi:DNA-binding MarR family transcriptional regulator